MNAGTVEKRSRVRDVRWAPRGSVWYATAALFLLSWAVAPGSVTSVSIDSMLPFAGILAIAAVGQTLVVQQRGIDLSVAGTMTLAALVVSKHAALHGGRLLPAIAVVVGMAIAVGLINGAVIGFLRVTPLVATLAMNSILAGIALAYSGGAPRRAPRALEEFSQAETIGVSNAVWVALAFVLLAAFVVSRTTWGRRFVAVGSSGRAAAAAGVRVELYRLSAYVAAALCYSAAGIVLAGYVATPNLGAGDAYLLPAIAAVVVGGTPLTGGRGNILGTAVAAVFLSQLTQLVLSMGAPTSTQLVIQSLVIAVAAALQARQSGVLKAFVRRVQPATPAS